MRGLRAWGLRQDSPRTYLINRNDRNRTTSSGAKALDLIGPDVGAEAPTPAALIYEMTSSHIPLRGGVPLVRSCRTFLQRAHLRWQVTRKGLGHPVL